jgi:hypothetical protein
MSGAGGDAAVGVLLAEREIERVLLRYCRGIDRLDEDLIRSVYHDGATDDHGVYQGDGKAFAAFIVPLLRDAYRATMHAIHNCQIEVDGTDDGAGAAAETYCVAYHERVDDAGERWLDLFACRYIDRFERRAGTWAIVRRVVVHDWDAVLPLTGDFGDMVKTFTAGRRDRDDESYRGKR